MKWSRNLIDSQLERDLLRVQMRLPFPDEKTIDVRRCRSILHVSSEVVHRLRATPITPGGDEMCLNAYNSRPLAPLRVEYDSLVRFLDHLRVRHAIPDRRPQMVWGRHRDEDLLPFKWLDTMTVDDAADVLNIHRSNVLLRIEAGEFEAYQFFQGAPWRISRSSLARHVASFSATAAASTRPYAASKLLQGER